MIRVAKREPCGYSSKYKISASPLHALTEEITSLMEYVDYSITVFACTVKGDEPHTAAIKLLL